MSDSGHVSAEPIAIVGMACRVPGANSVAQFWSNLVEGVESLHRGTLEEHAAAGVPPEVLEDPDFVPVNSVLPQPEYFDAGMFGMSAAEAELRDPQHRLFLELSYTAMEDAGYDTRRYRGDIGVYAGSGEDAYQWRNVRRNRAATARSGAVGLAVNSHPDYVATLASYHLGLRGPSMTVHTACSTSLVTVHLACEALRNGECDMALAGGVNLDLPMGQGYVYADGGILSRDGHCRTFDAQATGTVWGSGGAVVVLKPLHQAVADGDDVRAVIIGNAINNDGAAKAGFTAPSQHGQAAVIAQALSVAAVDPRTIGFVEAHGTATVLGDPIEVAALTSVYGRGTDERGWCAVGSVKTNIGHLGPASGCAGLLKAALAVQHGIIPASLNFETPNPAIAFGENPFYVNTSASVWDNGAPGQASRRAGVSSFGIGGTNAHIVIEQAPPRTRRGPGRTGPRLVQVSAKTEAALAASATALADHLAASGSAPGVDLDDVAYTLRAGRQELPQRLAVVAADGADAVKALRDEKRWISGSVGRDNPEPVFLFPGQGAQQARMGTDLYLSERVYRDAVDECCAVLADSGLPDGRSSLLEKILTQGGDDETVRETALAQPLLFIVEYALAQLLRSWGVHPRAMIGHSVGEYVAATCAGVFALPDAVRIVARRGDMMQSLPAGAMLAVQLGEDELRASLPEEASIAAVNGPEACVVSGPGSVIDKFAKTMIQAEISVRRLRTSHAFHSAMMDPIVAGFRAVVAEAELSEPTIPFASNITGGWITAAEATDPSYWARHIREAVRFGDCISTVANERSMLLECGPGRQLTGLARMQRRGQAWITCLPGPNDKATSQETLMASLARLWVSGCSLNIGAMGTAGNRVSLPTYPWERRYHWIKPDLDADDPDSRQSHDVASESRRAGWFAVPGWQQLAPAGSRPSAARILALVGDEDVIAAELSARGSDVIRVRRGDGYRADSSGGYTVRAASRKDYEAMFADLRERGGIPGHIVHCWTIQDDPADGAEATWAAQDAGFFSALAMIQALAGTAPESSIHLDIVTSGTQDVTGHDISRPEHATLAGAVKVLPLEFAWLTARHIDVDAEFMPRAAADDQQRLLASLADELSAFAEPFGSADEPLVALRNGRRWRRRFEDVNDDQLAGSAGVKLRERGVYLITGGLGGIGITLAEDLATRFKARLVLTSREDLPPRDRWSAPEVIAACSPRARRAIAAIRRMEEAGADVHVIPADIAEPATARTLQKEIIARFGTLHGIVHAAGIAGGGVAEIKDRDAAMAVLRPKVAGTLALRDAFGGHPLDFVVLCSSVTAIAGGFGQVDYCAANAFLDAHAGSQHGWQARVITVNWGAWQEVGMSAENAAPAEFRALQRGLRSYPVRHGLITERHPAEGAAQAWCSGTISPATHWLLSDHRLGGVPVLPGTAHLEAVRCAFEECYPRSAAGQVVELSDVVFTNPLAVPQGQAAELRVVFTDGEDRADFEVVSLADGDTQVHASGSAGWVAADGDHYADLAAIRERCSLSVREGEELTLSGSGLVTFGKRWGNLVRVHQGQGEELALLAARDTDPQDAYPWVIQPALLDEAVASGWSNRSGYLPFGYARVLIRRAMPSCVWSHLRYQENGTADMVTADITMYDEAGGELLRIEDFSMRQIDVAEMTEAVTAKLSGKSSETDGISLSDGAEAFRRLVGFAAVSQLVFSAISIQAKIEESRRVNVEALIEDRDSPDIAEQSATQPGDTMGFTNDIEREVAKIWVDLLGEKPDPTADFFGAGGNSLIAVQLIGFLRKRFGVRLPMRRFFADPTIAGIAALIGELLSSGEVTEGSGG